VELAKTLQPWAAILGHLACIMRMTKMSFGLIAAVFLLQSYYVRELLFAEVLVALGVVVMALIGAVIRPRVRRGFVAVETGFWAEGPWGSRQRKTPAAICENDDHRFL
jgi:hypothetical protein